MVTSSAYRVRKRVIRERAIQFIMELRRLTKVNPSSTKTIIRIPPFPMIKRINTKDRKEGINDSHTITSINRHISNNDDQCPFSLSVFYNDGGYFVKPNNGSMLHQHHARCDHLWSSSSAMNNEDNQLQHDLNQ
jgi:hypothetical protein